MAAVTDIANLGPHGRSELVLNADVYVVGVARAQCSRIHGDHRELSERRSCDLLPWCKDSWIAAVPIERRSGRIRASESRSIPVWHTFIVLNPNGYVEDSERTAEDPPLPRRIGKANLWSEVLPVLVLFEAVASTRRIHVRAANPQSWIDGRQIEIGPVPIFLVKSKCRIPAKP